MRCFGAVTKPEVKPGIHYRLPALFENGTVIKKDNVQKISTGRQELLTSDTNLITLNMAVHYKIADVIFYAFNVNNTGIAIVAVKLTEAIPPDSVKSSFHDLASARQDEAIYINEAIGYRNTLTPNGGCLYASTKSRRLLPLPAGQRIQALYGSDGQDTSQREKDTAGIAGKNKQR